MIVVLPIVFALVGAAAAGAAAAGGWLARRARQRKKAAAEAFATAAANEPLVGESDEPIDLGDVILVDGGRRELWLIRRCELREGDGDPFLVLFEADGPTARRALVVVDPLDPTRPSVLARADVESPLPAAAGNAFRPPSTLDVPLDGVTETLRLTLRRAARAKLSAIPDTELAPLRESPLPQGDELHVATYQGGPQVRALLVRVDAEPVRCFVGRSALLGEGAILRNRTSPAR